MRPQTPGPAPAAPSKMSGLDQLRDPGQSKGMAASIQERQLRGIHGLLPPRCLLPSANLSPLGKDHPPMFLCAQGEEPGRAGGPLPQEHAGHG